MTRSIQIILKDIQDQEARIAEEEYCGYYDSGAYVGHEPCNCDIFDGFTHSTKDCEGPQQYAHPRYYEILDSLLYELFTWGRSHERVLDMEDFSKARQQKMWRDWDECPF